MKDRAAPALHGLRHRALAILHDAFESEKGWVKVHAAEALMDFGRHDTVRQGITAAEGPWEGSTRIGHGRVMYALSTHDSEKQYWSGKIEGYYTDKNSPIGLNALESLCKLRFIAAGDTLEQIRRDSADHSKPEAPFALWALHNAGNQEAAFRIGEILSSSDCEIRKLTAFCLRWMKSGASPALKQLAELAGNEPRESEAYPFMRSAAVSLKADFDRGAEWKEDLVNILEDAGCSVRYEICQALKNDFTPADLETLLALLDCPDADVRIGSSAAIISLVDRQI